MKAFNVFNSNKEEFCTGIAANQDNAEYRSNIICASQNLLLVMSDYAITPTTKTAQLELLCDIIQRHKEPIALIAYDSSVITEKSQKNKFLPFVKAGKLDIHLSQYGLWFHHQSPKAFLEEMGMQILEEETRWGKLFEEYDEIAKSIKNTPAKLIPAKRFTRIIK